MLAGEGFLVPIQVFLKIGIGRLTKNQLFYCFWSQVSTAQANILLAWKILHHLLSSFFGSKCLRLKYPVKNLWMLKKWINQALMNFSSSDRIGLYCPISMSYIQLQFLHAVKRTEYWIPVMNSRSFKELNKIISLEKNVTQCDIMKQFCSYSVLNCEYRILGIHFENCRI